MRRPAAVLVPLAALLALGTVGGGATAASGRASSEAASLGHPVVAAPAPVHSLDRLDQRTRTAVSTLRPETVLVEDPTLPKDQLALRQEGVAGRVSTTLQITTYNGSVISQAVVDSEVVHPIAKVVAVGTMSEPPHGVWDRIAQCESNGNWAINTGNGYYGGLQFNLQTWRAMGGTGMPHDQSRAEQIRIAERVRDQSGGYGAWPACSRKLGLPR